MASKTVNLSEDAYNRLRSLKREGESFSDVINRVTGKYALLDLVGILSEEDARTAEKRIEKLRRRMRTGMESTRGKLQ